MLMLSHNTLLIMCPSALSPRNDLIMVLAHMLWLPPQAERSMESEWAAGVCVADVKDVNKLMD